MALIPPPLRTPRLLLRPFLPEDAPAVQGYLSAWEVASTTAALPHPYPEGAAAEWIAGHPERQVRGEAVVLAAVLREGGALVGEVELRTGRGGHRAELGYWTGLPHQRRGYAAEAAGALVRWALETRGLHRVHAATLARNPASAAVLRRIGMRREGTLRRHLLRWGVLEDVELYGILAGDLPPAGEAGATSAASPG
jgi:[ribosomal protein S5]-alanine N-acetyltransferase